MQFVLCQPNTSVTVCCVAVWNYYSWKENSKHGSARWAVSVVHSVGDIFVTLPHDRERFCHRQDQPTMVLAHTKELICNNKLDLLRLYSVVLYLPNSLEEQGWLTHPKSYQVWGLSGWIMGSQKALCKCPGLNITLLLSITVGSLTYRPASQSMFQRPPGTGKGVLDLKSRPLCLLKEKKWQSTGSARDLTSELNPSFATC